MATARAKKEPPPPPPPEAPPANFGPPPPGYEPPPPWSPGDTPTTPSPTEVEAAPGFMTLDRFDAHTRMGIQVGFDKVDDGVLMRFNPYGQIILPGTKIGLYGQWAIAHGFLDGDDATGYSNLELGGFYMPLSRSNDLILRAGLVAPTASEDDALAVDTNAASTLERYTDFVLALPSSTAGRLSASTMQQFGDLFFRAEGGFDFVIDRPSAATSASVFFRANAGLGYRIPDIVDFTAELMNIVPVNGEVDGGITDRFVHTLGFSVRTPGTDQFHFGTVFPLDSVYRGEIWIVSAGYQRAFN